MIKIKLYANLREVAGKEVPVSGGEGTLGEVLERLFQRHPALRDAIMEGGELRRHVNVLLNGRNVLHLQGLDTRVKEGDEIAVFPPVAGGGEKSACKIEVVGVPRWAVEQYLREMGAEAEGDVYRCEAGSWSAEIIEEGPDTIRVDIKGSKRGVERAEKKLRLKCLRAGG